MKQILVITEDNPFGSSDMVDAFVIDFELEWEQARTMLNLSDRQNVYLFPYQEGRLGIKRVHNDR